MQINLVPVDGDSSLTITNPITVVGRNPAYCDLVISDDQISAVHCVIARVEAALYVRDMGSSNGTFVNGVEVLQSAILPGDEIGFADIKFRLKVDQSGQFRKRKRSHEVTTYVPKPPSENKGGSSSDQSRIQVYDSFVGRVVDE